MLPWLLARKPPSFSYPLTASNIFGWLTFEWIFVGFSEEILFRGLIHTFLARYWQGVWQIGKLAFPTAGLGATILFCLAHVNFRSWHVDWGQQFFAFGLGIYYSTTYHRTRSLLGSILSHNFSDGSSLRCCTFCIGVCAEVRAADKDRRRDQLARVTLTSLPFSAPTKREAAPLLAEISRYPLLPSTANTSPGGRWE